MERQSYTTRNILLFLLAFLGLGAIGGGGIFIISTSGKLFGMPLSMLDKSPFSNFLIPGIILFLMLGIAPLLLMIALVKKPNSKFANQFNFFKYMHWSCSYTIYISIALIGWIQIQMIFLNAVNWLHTVYMFLAVPIIFVALLPGVKSLYKID